METKNEKFTRLATKRVNKVLDEMRKLTSLVAPSYSSSQEERQAIIRALRSGVEEIEISYGGDKNTNKKAFSFNPSNVEQD